MPGQPIACERCKQPAPYRGGAQRYCIPCSTLRDLQRKGQWARTHPAKPEVTKRARTKKVSAQRARGLVANAAARDYTGIAWPADIPRPHISRSKRIAVPFSWNLSKNAMWRMVPGSHVTLRQEARVCREAITAALAGPERWPQRITYLDILVEKPNHKGDALNLIDSIADAVKEAIGVDDRWFSISRLEWRIVKNNPMVYIGVGQDGDADQQVCSTCGAIKDLGDFPVSKTARMGRHRICLHCQGRH